MSPGTSEIISNLIGYILSIQLMFGFLIFLLESTMTNYYALATYEKPNNFFHKFANLFMLVTVGTGYHIYLKLRNYKWLVRKVLFLIALVLQALVSVIIYIAVLRILEATILI